MSYADRLADLACAAREPRSACAPTFASLFAGGGGSSLGYLMAGFREIAAVEYDARAQASLRRNFRRGRYGDHDVDIYGDITQIDWSMLGIENLDLLDASPPCQGFSSANVRGDESDKLRKRAMWMYFVDAVRELSPRVTVMENVEPMARSPELRGVVSGLASLGYTISVRVLSADWLGVPQARKRLILVATREGWQDLVWPAPRPPRLTLRDAISDIVDPATDAGSITPRAQSIWRHLRPGRSGRDLNGRNFSLVRLRWDRPCKTVCATRTTGVGLMHPDEPRFLGIRELARVQSFPDCYDWGDLTPEEACKIIGNSVPPLMMYELASMIRARL